MKRIALTLTGPVLLSLGLGIDTDPDVQEFQFLPVVGHTDPDDFSKHNEVLEEYCFRCHGDVVQKAEMSLKNFDVGTAEADAELAEKMIRKLRAGMMPPAGEPRPAEDVLKALAVAVEERVDGVALPDPDPGNRSFQRLNRAEYRASVLELLDLDVDASELLPLDTKSANFDNIADAQPLSATLLEAYLSAADEVARLAVGDPNAPVKVKTFTNIGFVSQWERVEGAPRGTRGGVSAMFNFPADGEYVFEMAFEHTTTGGFTGGGAPNQDIDISIDGARVALVHVDRYMSVSQPNGAYMWTEPIFVKAGPRRVTAAFIKMYDGPLDDPLSPYEWSLVTRGGGGSAMTVLPHIKDLAIKGPYNPTGVSETPSRKEIFSRRPISPDEEREVAQEILSRLGAKGFRRPLEDEDIRALMGFYEDGAKKGGFELGVRTGIQAILSSPDFVFRFERPPANVEPGENYPIRDVELASRLSFFLWGSIPDDELFALGIEGKLSDPGVLEEQVDRMLKDPRSEAIATRFGAQWLRLDDLEKVQPDRLMYPDFYTQLGAMMRKETELFFNSLVQEDRSILDLLTADYTFVNGPLARHYGIQGVGGHAFQRVELDDENRRGILGQASVLMLTSHANRTSPVLRGKWIMEVLLGSPPPPPPPEVPEFDETDEAADGRLLSVAERLAMHRSNPVCNACHRMIDPMGVALENFDVTGRWRIKDNLNPIDTATEMYDGTRMNSAGDLRAALLSHPESFTRTVLENLMAYALGRRVEYYDMPSIREIARQAEADNYEMSSLILGVVKSPAFRMSRARASAAPENGVEDRTPGDGERPR